MDGPSNNARSAVLVGANVAFLVAIGHLYWSMDSLRGDVLSLRQSVVAELAKMRVTAPAADRKSLTAAELRRIDEMRRELETQLSAANRQAAAAARSAKVEAVTHADQIAQKLGNEQQSKHQEVTSEIGEVKQSTNAKLDSVSTELSEVKNQVASTRFELERTISDLKRVTGDLGVQSGLIATNAQELAVLKALGERNYFDFHLERGRHPQRVGDVSLVLKRTDPKRNRYSLEIIVGDAKTDKKDRTINEPVQFYVSRSKLPYEIVVNEVQKDFVLGYLSTPKALVERSGL